MESIVQAYSINIATLACILLQTVAGTSSYGSPTPTGGSVPLSERAEGIVRQIEQDSPKNILRGKDGTVYGLTVLQKYVSDENIALISQLRELTEIKLYLSSQGQRLSVDGLKTIGRLSNLHSLTITCPRLLDDGFLNAICQFKQLRVLQLNSAVPPAEEYGSLTNLLRLEGLCIYDARYFGDRELQQLENLPLLKKLSLSGSQVSKDWPSIVRQFPSLEQAIFENDGERLTWTKRSSL